MSLANGQRDRTVDCRDRPKTVYQSKAETVCVCKLDRDQCFCTQIKHTSIVAHLWSSFFLNFLHLFHSVFPGHCSSLSLHLLLRLHCCFCHPSLLIYSHCHFHQISGSFSCPPSEANCRFREQEWTTEWERGENSFKPSTFSFKPSFFFSCLYSFTSNSFLCMYVLSLSWNQISSALSICKVKATSTSKTTQQAGLNNKSQNKKTVLTVYSLAGCNSISLTEWHCGCIMQEDIKEGIKYRYKGLWHQLTRLMSRLQPLIRFQQQKHFWLKVMKRLWLNWIKCSDIMFKFIADFLMMIIIMMMMVMMMIFL